ncbi:MAG TPA: cytochrome c oxidase subunit 3 [Dehalococcoidia bacterium]|jgi:cytochrome c oxidase subunit 3|nr:cytochrome c oxidase subunit 3 [Dehalococcoidia bacterium]
MTVATTAAHADQHATRRASINQLGLWLFFLSESFLFCGLASSRFYLAGATTPSDVNQVLGLAITSILLLSSFTAYNAEAAIARGDRATFLRFIRWTILLGLVFVGGVAIEWSTAEFGPKDPYGTAFFTMTGIHASHVISGIGMLGLVYYLGKRGHFSAESHWGVEGVIKYWHFVDVVWVFFYPVLYLINWR